jgi:uncharacterized protein YoaH (UPF0181 family)
MHEAAVTVVQRLYGTVISTGEAIQRLGAALGSAATQVTGSRKEATR